MGLGVRTFIIREDDSIQRVPVQLFNRLINNEPHATLPEFAGQRVRYVLVMLQTEDRRPVAVRHVDCSYLQFDRSGRLDRAAQDEAMRIAMRMIDPPELEPRERPTSVLQAAHLFERRAFKHRYKWEPSRALLDQLSKSIFPGKASSGPQPPPRPGPRPA